MTIQQLREYLENLPEGWVVTGHPAPDTDAAISALFEAYRLTRSGTPARPVLQGALPRETAWLLGDLAPLIPTTDALDPAVPLVLTDHNDVVAYPNPVMAIVDHHPATATHEGIDACIQPVGAATTLVAQRLEQDGVVPDAACARLLAGAILMDTERLSGAKTKPADLACAGWLMSLCQEDAFVVYDQMRDEMLSETDLEVLYRRDYRVYADAQGTPRLGWAILKVWADTCPDLDAVRRRLSADPHPTRVAKIVLNSRTANTRTEYYLAQGAEAEEVLCLTMAMGGEAVTRMAEDATFLPENAHQKSRKAYVAYVRDFWSKKK